MRRTDFLQMADKLAQAGGAITGALYQKEQLGEAKKVMNDYRDSQVVQSVLGMLPTDKQEPYLTSLSELVKSGKPLHEASKLAVGGIMDNVLRTLQPGKEKTTGTPLVSATNPVTEATKPMDYLDLAKSYGAFMGINTTPTPTNYVQPLK